MDERTRLRRLQLVSCLREVEHREAAGRLHAEMGRESHARLVADRTTGLLEHYQARRDARDALELGLQQVMAQGTRQMHRSARDHLSELSRQTEVVMQQEQAARRRRDRTQEMADKAARQLADAEHTADSVQQRTGTILDHERS
ncbi:hypothetical protein GRI58_02285 [Porphyrobacter algicida]|uniref:Flagellar FliJ protein n=1 Tax=Qipengyuania algicida TaxID=1836209 RepID=A0A845AE29_9SPHN|nr:hypothetical protein [Qipengyuania algicida]MXP27649.1 hypothetical protein [Qipengyuania algicida]